MRPCKAKCIQQSLPLQFCVIDRKLNGMCLVEKFHQFTKKKKKNHQQPSNKHASQLLLCVYKLLYKLFKLGGTQHFSCPNLSCCPAESTGDSPNTL